MIALCVMDSSITSLHSEAGSGRSRFRFFDLPAELRRKILRMVLLVDRTIDLDPLNHRRIARCLDVFLVSKRFHEECYPIFYGSNTFRIFPTHGRFFGNKVLPLLARLSARYRAALVMLELRLGPGWDNPPKSWRVNDGLGLEEAKRVRILKVYVEVDPSHDIFNGFRITKDFFTDFSGFMLRDVIDRLPALEEVQFDAYPSVSRDAALMSRLLEEARQRRKRIGWGPERGWDSDMSRIIDKFHNVFSFEVVAA